MCEELYEWVRNLAVFYILFTAVLHLVPDKKYERYIRSFMGLLLIYMLCTPVLAVIGRSGELFRNFQVNYRNEQKLMEKKSSENLQALYLTQGYEKELGKNIMEKISGTGIKITDAAVNIDGERTAVTLYADQELTPEEEGEIYDVLRRDFGIEKKDCQIVAARDDEKTLGRSSPSGAFAGSDGASDG